MSTLNRKYIIGLSLKFGWAEISPIAMDSKNNILGHCEIQMTSISAVCDKTHGQNRYHRLL